MQSSLSHGTKTIEDMYELALSEGVGIFDYALPLCGAVSVMDGKDCFIGLDNSRRYSDSERKTMLAHELGHCQTGAFYNEYTPYSVRGKCERRADEWAILNCVPYDALMNAFRSGVHRNFELAEHFGVSEQLIAKALKYYIERKYNASYRENS